MPLYEYHDLETGVTASIRRPVTDRNKPIILTRKQTFPTNIVVMGAMQTEGQAFDQKIIKAYYKKEEREGSRFRSGYSKKQLKKVWAR